MAGRVHDAIVSWWAGQSSIKALTSDGKLWHAEAPESTRLPYVTLTVPREPERAGRTTAYYHLDATAVFAAHAETDAAAASIRNAIRDAIKNAAMSNGGESPYHVIPGSQSLSIGEGRGPSGSDCWIATIEVSIPWQRFT